MRGVKRQGPIDGQTCLVTGGTKGIGWNTAQQLASQGGQVTITSRDPARGEQAIYAIREKINTDKTHNGSIDVIQADFRSLDSVRRLAREFKQRHNKLNILVN